MKDLKITKGEFEKKYVGPICIGIGTKGNYSQITTNSILPETDEDYEKEKEEIEANMELYADAGTTANKSGLLPSELLRQRDELIEALKNTLSALKAQIGSSELAKEWIEVQEAEKAINNTKGE